VETKERMEQYARAHGVKKSHLVPRQSSIDG